MLIIATWGATGSAFHYSNAWQLIINTGTTVVTFLMVFLIQNTQNRDAKATQLKLDEMDNYDAESELRPARERLAAARERLRRVREGE